ncbi:MAG TPA: NACHT domain-containing protein [Pyrinomonadaceae bacterium]|nr:NACHT domain-containing protein [Pyrinomonadaceae bacterium]
MFLLDLFSSLSERGKLFIIVFFSSLIAILLSLLVGGWLATSIVIIPTIIGILQATKGVWTPEGGSKSKVGIASLGIALVTVISSPFWKSYIESLLEPIYEQYPTLRDKLPTEAPTIATLVFIAAVILIVNYFARDKSAMKEHTTPLEKEFPEKEYKKLLDSFSGVLLDDLNKIDRETNWSAEFFTPLEAEVEIKSGTKRLKKITDLLTAIRSDRKSRVFLVLGDPGSGKSVALRKLCRDLLSEVKRTGKIPLYVNLREWENHENWTEDNPPTVQQLYDFVLSNLKNRGDVFVNEFLDKYFKKMFENGRLFIVLDSFDEIPFVMDVDEKSWLIDSLSDVIYRFLAGMNESRGILASRIFRRPTDKFDAKTIFEIRPFTEKKIVESLQKSLYYDENLINLLFNERQEFISVARNPFSAALIASYAKEHNNTLPQTQSELYSSYIERRLESCRERMEKKKLTAEKVFKVAVEIADVMLTTKNLGLEASRGELRQAIQDKSVDDVIDILKYARLGRLGGGDEQRFSFVHRRFNEYFVVQRLIELPNKIPQDAIPTDSRWRDALVLYCEVASEAEARKIADYCWSEISKLAENDIDLNDPQYLRSVHCLRFIKEAFRARLDCIDSFRSELADFILEQINEDNNLLSIKLSVEAVGLLEEKDIDSALVKALKINNNWINETAIKSCHYLPSLSKELKNNIIEHFNSIRLLKFYEKRKEILFSLNLSSVFDDIRTFCYWRLVDCYLLFLVAAFLFIIRPILGFIFITSIILTQYTKIYNFADIRLSLIIVLAIFIEFPFSVENVQIESILRVMRSSFFPVDSDTRWYFIVIAIPWFEVYYFMPNIKDLRSSLNLLWKELENTLKKFTLRIIITLLSIGILAYLLILILDYMPKSFNNYIIIFGGIVLLGVLFVFLFTYLSIIVKDYLLLVKIKKNLDTNREIISQNFYRFRRSEAKLKYVRVLQNQAIKPKGNWLDGKIPNHENDEASTLLAQLEEKWLGLDK